MGVGANVTRMLNYEAEGDILTHQDSTLVYPSKSTKSLLDNSET